MHLSTRTTPIPQYDGQSYPPPPCLSSNRLQIVPISRFPEVPPTWDEIQRIAKQLKRDADERSSDRRQKPSAVLLESRLQQPDEVCPAAVTVVRCDEWPVYVDRPSTSSASSSSDQPRLEHKQLGDVELDTAEPSYMTWTTR